MKPHPSQKWSAESCRKHRKPQQKISGVYAIHADGVVVYVGGSVSVTARVMQHIRSIKTEQYGTIGGRFPQVFKNRRVSFSILEQCSEEVLADRELHWIKTHKPVCNVRHMRRNLFVDSSNLGTITILPDGSIVDHDGDLYINSQAVADAVADAVQKEAV